MKESNHPEVVLMGAGNLANHLGMALFSAGIKVRQVVNRTQARGELLAKKLHASFASGPADMDMHADVYILAVSDHAVHHLAAGLKIPGKLVLHVSGTIDMQILNAISTHTGVLYPLLTFPQDHVIDFRGVPMCIEANTPANLEQVQLLARKISDNVYMVDSIQRRWLHLAAVFACNFTNFMYAISQDILREKGIDFELLRPLIRQTEKNAEFDHAFDFQTGPAYRNDFSTMQKQVQLLEGEPDFRDIYNLLSEGIIKYKNRNGQL